MNVLENSLVNSESRTPTAHWNHDHCNYFLLFNDNESGSSFNYYFFNPLDLEYFFSLKTCVVSAAAYDCYEDTLKQAVKHSWPKINILNFHIQCWSSDIFNLLLFSTVQHYYILFWHNLVSPCSAKKLKSRLLTRDMTLNLSLQHLGIYLGYQ